MNAKRRGKENIRDSAMKGVVRAGPRRRREREKKVVWRDMRFRCVSGVVSRGVKSIGHFAFRRFCGGCGVACKHWQNSQLALHARRTHSCHPPVKTREMQTCLPQMVNGGGMGCPTTFVVSVLQGILRFFDPHRPPIFAVVGRAKIRG